MLRLALKLGTCDGTMPRLALSRNGTIALGFAAGVFFNVLYTAFAASHLKAQARNASHE